MDPTETTTGRTSAANADRHALRYARNQLWSRRINDQIARLKHSSAFGEYVCECGLKTCVAPISLSVAEFDEVRKEPWRFVVQPGHWSRKYERPVRAESRYEVVEKLPAAKVLLRRLPGLPRRDAR